MLQAKLSHAATYSRLFQHCAQVYLIRSQETVRDVTVLMHVMHFSFDCLHHEVTLMQWLSGRLA